MGWDEAFLAVETPDPGRVAREVQAAVLGATGPHCSVGIGDNKPRAKIATEYGIGRKTARRLAGLGIDTVRELAADSSPVVATPYVPRSHGRESSFRHGITSAALELVNRFEPGARDPGARRPRGDGGPPGKG